MRRETRCWGRRRTGRRGGVNVVQVSSDFFATLGVNPELGRGFRREEELPGARVAVLSHDTWQTEFNGDRKVIGRTVVFSDMNFTVVGVMPAGFGFPIQNVPAAAWITMSLDAEGVNPSAQQRGWNQLAVVGRLKDGVTPEQAQDDMNRVAMGLAKQYPDDDSQETAVSVKPVLASMVEDVAKPLKILFWAVCCLLLIVCANVAGLLLTRTSQRRGELAIRSALGATRGQILRQLMTESMVLSLGGGVLGVAATWGMLKAAPSVLPANLPRVGAIAMDGRVLGFAIGVSVLTGLVFGVLPAWLASKQDPARALGESGRSGIAGRRHYRLQSVLVVSQTALGLVLLVGAGLLIRSFEQTMKVDPGFSPGGMVTFRIAVPEKRYSDEKQVALVHELLPRLKALPGVSGATAAFPMPLTNGDIRISFELEGATNKPGDYPSAGVALTETGYFETMRIALKRGRLFVPTEQDAKGAPVVIVNEAFAQMYFPNGDALGKHMRSGLGSSLEDANTPPMREIVGIVANVKRLSLTETDRPQYYIPYEQAPVSIPFMAMRVSGDAGMYERMVTAEVANIDRGLPVYRFASYGEELKRITAQERFQTLLLSGFAGVALLLAGLGLYAVLSYMVTQRRMELGLRIALGAQRGAVLGMMLRRGLSLAAVGLGLGLVAAAGLTRFVAGLLFGVKALDGVTFGGMAMVLLGVSVVASLIPAWRASLVDPNVALRE